ncbi:hypothetical protein SKAU_G00012260 [Synaphobranchus kaupii]|uniref:Uncharacterized protein n=1 Tax=Synaphobranchus kaupii TaxID=118154 RepID=A0A9Q1GBD5_SYNKA|nr:hypothetical protein SKAU_G00012260 [Synaphobranchus kaupii]
MRGPPSGTRRAPGRTDPRARDTKPSGGEHDPPQQVLSTQPRDKSKADKAQAEVPRRQISRGFGASGTDGNSCGAGQRSLTSEPVGQRTPGGTGVTEERQCAGRGRRGLK